MYCLCVMSNNYQEHTTSFVMYYIDTIIGADMAEDTYVNV